jgi:hypothetical protein
MGQVVVAVAVARRSLASPRTRARALCPRLCTRTRTSPWGMKSYEEVRWAASPTACISTPQPNEKDL